MLRSNRTVLAGAIAALFLHVPALADDFVLQRVLVEGSRTSQIGAMIIVPASPRRAARR